MSVLRKTSIKMGFFIFHTGMEKGFLPGHCVAYTVPNLKTVGNIIFPPKRLTPEIWRTKCGRDSTTGNYSLLCNTHTHTDDTNTHPAAVCASQEG